MQLKIKITPNLPNNLNMNKSKFFINLSVGVLCMALQFFGQVGFAMGQPSSPAPVAIQPVNETSVAQVPVTAPPLLFTINADNKIAVQVTIPPRFAPIVGQDKVAEAIKNGLVEYIPKDTQDLKNWTELITVIPLSNSAGVQAHTFRDLVFADLRDKTNAFIMINSAFKNEKEYQVATAIARYQLKGRTEILYFYAISGPKDLVSIQYIRAVSPKEDLPKLIDQLSAIFAQNVKIIKE